MNAAEITAAAMVVFAALSVTVMTLEVIGPVHVHREVNRDVRSLGIPSDVVWNVVYATDQ